MKRWLLRIIGLLVFLLVAAVVVAWVASEPRPSGKAGPWADGLARKIMGDVHIDNWNRTGAVKWNFAGRYEHLWDKRRGFVRTRWDDTEVLLDTNTRKGIVTAGGRRLEGDEAASALEHAYGRFINDSFWLNPFAGFFDEGVTRELVTLEGNKKALLVSYPASGGGVTPGDAYLWFPKGDYDYKPERWKMWVSILPIGGLEVSWEDYKILQTGAVVSTKHSGLLDFELTDVAAGPDAASVAGEDPFGPLEALVAPPSAEPSSRPAP